MVKLIAVKLHKENVERDYKNIITYVDDATKLRMRSTTLTENAVRIGVSNLLCKLAVLRSKNHSYHDIVLTRTKYGKPLLQADRENTHFNTSHSGLWVVCAADNEPIGIDIEERILINFTLLDKYFSDIERNDYLKEENQKKSFYKIWTLKESYLKAIGIGLYRNMDFFTIKHDGIDYRVIESDFDRKWNFQIYEIDLDYTVSVCSRKKSFPQYFEILNVKNLISEITSYQAHTTYRPEDQCMVERRL